MTRLLCFTTVCALTVSPASADEYWVSYEGNDFPENETKNHQHHQGVNHETATNVKACATVL